MKVKCFNCNYSFGTDPKRTVGCLCDSDSPTWLGLTPDNKLMTMSYAKYEIEEN